MSPAELQAYLSGILKSNIRHAVMIWGKPGIGKSSIVNQLCQSHELDFIDLRLSQLMPSDLRGVPVPEEGITHWSPPSFLPQDGAGVLFMDELNMAPPALQGVAQQLILDRRVGNYILPEDWFIWAAGNRKTDKAAVFEMPGPLANRFIHLNVDLSLDDFKQYAYRNNLSSEVIGFLSYRPDLLHEVHSSEPNWPSPRTWEMASNLFQASMDVEPAVGAAAAMEFSAFIQLKNQLPDIQAILAGKDVSLSSTDPSVRYATISALVNAIEKAKQAENAFLWLIGKMDEEWVHCFASDLLPQLREKKQYNAFAKSVINNDKARKFLTEFVELIS